MIDYVIRGAVDGDAYILAPIMRDYDRAELWASSGKTPLQGLQAGLTTADEAYTALADGIPFCMFGVSPLTNLGNTGSPWLLTSKDLRKHQKELLRWSRKTAHHWLETKYSLLINFIDARHQPALRWAKWVGFDILDPIPFGPEKLLFHRVEMRRKDV